MSRSYSKVKKVGICKGDNRSYYKIKRRTISHINRHSVRNTWANTHDAELFDEKYIAPKVVLRDDWVEPTDGIWLMDAKYIDKSFNVNRRKDGVSKVCGHYRVKNMNKVKK